MKTLARGTWPWARGHTLRKVFATSEPMAKLCRPRLRSRRGITALLFLLFALIAMTARSQYAIDWFTVDGGGGLSSGGAFTVHGTIGQPDAGFLCDGNFSLQGGFWGLVPLPPRPSLRIARSGGNVIIAWPDPSVGFQLETTTSLPAIPSAWTDVLQIPIVIANEKRVSLLIGPGNHFFRLRQMCD